MATPIGQLKVTANDSEVLAIAFIDPDEPNTNNPTGSNAIVEQALAQLSQYFAKQRQQFDLPLGAKSTEFRQQVWQSLCDIDYGETASYSDIAHAIDNPKAVRAVGAANGANPIAIVVPCHRVIGKNGTLTGYAGGLNRKQWLLEFEQNSDKR